MIETLTETVTTTLVPTPAGPVRVAVAGRPERVVVLAFDDHFERVAARVRRRLPGPWVEGGSAAAEAVRRYVDGDVHALDDLDVDVAGTPFQQRVWAALRGIPAGTTWSYRELAAAVGAPGAVRAVGTANGANPVWLAVPCHRVVRADGSLGGYGGGVERKEWLLAHERR
ncbi:MAG TPA: methylated-DNA--[protein]-cysteine S-methyltransferase [Acidimicrobiales bacterium]|nr:methylated-DNA--[protein]-cysteine S-methyltransferase [Acidimicrobiales bacterium]